MLEIYSASNYDGEPKIYLKTETFLRITEVIERKAAC